MGNLLISKYNKTCIISHIKYSQALKHCFMNYVYDYYKNQKAIAYQLQRKSLISIYFKYIN